MRQIIYISTATVPFSDDDLTDLLAKARQNNQSIGVTGMLVFDRGTFLQAIEGSPQVVQQLFHKIRQDTRHTDIMMLAQEAIQERDFRDWSMGFIRTDRRDAWSSFDGPNDFFTGANWTRRLRQEDSLARKVLLGFRKGQWRRGAA